MSEENETNWTQRLSGRLPWYTVPAILIVVPLLAILVGRVFPPFYDNVLWKYYWGPIVTDAAQRSSMTHNGVVAHSGYNIVNTLSWAVLMGVCIVGLTQLLTAIRTKMNNTVIWGATAWVVSGAVWHVLQDTQLFEPPLEYMFITPPIYLLFAAGGILSLLIGVYVERVAAAAGNERALQKLWLIMSIGVLLYTLAWAADWSQVIRYVNPVHVALFAALNFFVVAWRVARTGRVESREMVLMLALAPFLLALDYVWLFTAEPWGARDPGMPSAVWLAPLLALAATLLVAGTAATARTGARRGLNWLIGGAALLLAGLGWAFRNDEGMMLRVFIFVLLVFLLAWGAARLLRTRVDIFVGIVVAGASLAGVWIVAILIAMVTGRLLDLDLGVWRFAVAAVIVAGFLLSQRAALAEGRERLRAQKSATTTALLAYVLPVNLLLIFSQMVDGFATALGIDLAGYVEKHVLSGFIILGFRDLMLAQGWQWAADHATFLIFVPIKLLISLAVVYAIDIYSKEDVEKYPTLIGFIKFAIIMVGIGPGVRDFVRLALGV